MKFLVAVVAALCLTQVLEARVVRSTQSEDWQQSINAALQNITTTFQNVLPSGDEFRAQLQNHSQTLATSLQTLATSFSEKATQLSGEAQTAIRQVGERLGQDAARLRQQYPDASQTADKFKEGMQSLANQLAALQPHADSIGESLKSVARTTVEQATALTNQVQQQVQQASNAH